MQDIRHSRYTSLDCSIGAYGVIQDPDVTQEYLSAWRTYTKLRFYGADVSWRSLRHKHFAMFPFTHDGR